MSLEATQPDGNDAQPPRCELSRCVGSLVFSGSLARSVLLSGDRRDGALPGALSDVCEIR